MFTRVGTKASKIARLVPRVRQLSSEAASENTLKTSCYDAHVQLGGKVVPFAGYWLPVQYKDGMVASHLHCRKGASLWDVSHMGQLRIWGKKRLDFLETLTIGDLKALKLGQIRLSNLTNEEGGIIDDCMITHKNESHVYMVVNAACKAKDLAHMTERLAEYNSKTGADVRIENLDPERSLIALQGPKAMEVVQKLIPNYIDLRKVDFMNHLEAPVGGIPCFLARCGYTGEDGFEISVAHEHAGQLMLLLCEQEHVKPAGLGVRDSLRLEAGLCLYGNDIDATTSPVEGNLVWLIGKRRREEGGFLGAERILRELKEGVSRKRVGMFVNGAPAREHTDIQDEDGNKIGVVTSGGFSPCLKRSISMGYVPPQFAKPGSKVKVVVRGNPVDATVTKMPFVPNGYYHVGKPKKM